MVASENGAQSHSSERGVQDRLAEAAEELFSRRGFNETSVRDIAAAADCNVASINYYFGSKDNLYVEVWRRRLVQMRDVRLAGIERVMSAGGRPQLEELLRSYANAFVEPLVDGSRSDRFITLMAREMIDPHLPRQMFVEEMIVPVMQALAEALRQICPWLEDGRTQLIILSIVGQLMHAVMARAMFERSDHPGIADVDLGAMVDHVVRFSAAGIRAYRNGAGE